MVTNGSRDIGELYVLAYRYEVPTLRRAIIDRPFQLAKAEREMGVYHRKKKLFTTLQLRSCTRDAQPTYHITTLWPLGWYLRQLPP